MWGGGYISWLGSVERRRQPIHYQQISIVLIPKVEHPVNLE
jgi:hypothetical protein